MANHKSAIKKARMSLRRNTINTRTLTEIRTLEKKLRKSIAKKDKTEIDPALEAKKKADAHVLAMQKDVTAAQKSMTEFLDGKTTKPGLKAWSEEKLRLLTSQPFAVSRTARPQTKTPIPKKTLDR